MHNICIVLIVIVYLIGTLKLKHDTLILIHKFYFKLDYEFNNLLVYYFIDKDIPMETKGLMIQLSHEYSGD